MKQENWLLCHVHAFDYFGGVPRLLISDNAKTATITNNRYEVVLNRSYQELAEHYGTAIVPARVRRPDDKAAVDSSVKYVSTWITPEYVPSPLGRRCPYQRRSAVFET